MCYNLHMKARTNVSLDKELLDSAKKYNIVISALLEKAIKYEIKAREEESWIKENNNNLKNYNNRVRETGVFSDEIRNF